VAAGILESVAPDAARHLRSIPHGSTGVVSLGYRADQFPEPLIGHGFLVADGEPLSISACTWSSLKWTDRAPTGTVLTRAFIGTSGERLLDGSDDEVVAAAVHDVELTTGVRGAPVLARVARWPGAMPNYTVGHLDRVAAAVASLDDLPSVVLAGAAYRGVGLPDCIAQGRDAAARLQALLGPSADGTPAPGPRAAARDEAAALPLDHLPVGGGGRVVSVGPAFRDELAGEGVRPGADLSVSAAAPFGGPLVVLVGQARVALARSVAGTVHVAVEPARTERRA
jgi:Fe2+ transport system protein FeoA